MKSLLHGVVLLALLLTPLAGLPCPVASAGSRYDERLAHFKATGKHRALGVRTAGQEFLAASHDPRAIAELGRRYASPRAPKAQTRHLVVASLARHFDRPQFTSDLARLRKKHAEPEDAWLWYRTLVIHGRHAGAAVLLAAARDEELPIPLRAAAIEAAATLAEPELAELVPALLAAPPPAAADRALLAQTLATGLLSVRENAASDVVERAAEALIVYLERGSVDALTSVTLGRVLKELLDARFAYLDGAAWRKHTTHPGAARKSEAPRLQKLRCAGVKGYGARVAYLLDMSAGAAEPVSPEERERLLDEPRPLASRLALMQHVVGESIRALKPEQSFVVLAYAHHGVGALAGLDRLVPATHENKMAAIQALRGLSAAGAADLHAGLMRAFQAHGDGFVGANEHLAPETLLGGCDTIYLLNHSPSHVDQWVPEKASRRKQPARTLATGSRAWGVYPDPLWLQGEVDRWQLFHKVKLHAIPFGRSHEDVLRMVARHADGFLPRAAGAVALTLPEADETYGALRKAYRTFRKRPSLKKRTLGRSRLAAGKSLLALAELAEDYADPEKPKPLVQQLLVDICADTFGSREALPLFARWRGRHGQRTDAWLWHRALEVALEQEDTRTVFRTATEAHDPFLRAAAMRIATKLQYDDLLAFIPGWVKAIRKSKREGLERLLAIEAMATALNEFGMAKDEDTYKEAALALLDVFDDETTPKRTKLTIVRNLAAGLEVPPDGLQKNAWVREVRAGGSGVGMADARYGAPTFGGLRASGTRICYVIDMSDSMLTPLKPGERLKPKVVTGDSAPRKRRPEDEINWAKVKNRFDLARALLITSLQSLRPNTHFCVIWFGSEAGMLRSTPGLVPTTPAHVAKAVKELRKIKPGAAGEGEHKTNVKWGSLQGETNLHGGLTRAFTRTGKKAIGGFSYVSETGLMEGCDTIFLLSDGAPSTDDFCQVDKRDPEDHAVEDRESMKKTADTPELTYPGPYGAPFRTMPLLQDIRRRNLFRQVEIHCLGIGEANMGLLQNLSNLGLGASRKIGEDTK